MASSADPAGEKRVQSGSRLLGDFNARLLQVANVWIDVFDVDGNVLVWNEEAERISGYLRREVVGHDRIWEWIYPNPEYRAEVRRKRQEALVEGRPFWGDEATIRTRSGEERILSLYGGSFVGEDGKAGALVMVAHDVTDRRRSEQSLREYSMQVGQLLREKAVFLSTLSHELRTPLAAIRGFADLLASEDQLRPEALTMVERIRTQAERLDAFLRDLLAYSRGDFARKESLVSPADFARVLGQVVEALRPRLAAKGHSLDCDGGSGVGLVSADQDDLEHVLTNILSNSISYTPSGGKLWVRLRKLTGFLEFEITDNGIGFSPEERDRVFDEFYRTAAAKRMKKDGTGLGLSIVKRLVGGWGGSVWMTSPGEGQGSTTVFAVPLAQPPQAGKSS